MSKINSYTSPPARRTRITMKTAMWWKRAIAAYPAGKSRIMTQTEIKRVYAIVVHPDI